jgi:hypothetical protein
LLLLCDLSPLSENNGENELSLRLHGKDAQVMSAPVMNLPLEIAGRRFQSRLMAS